MRRPEYLVALIVTLLLSLTVYASIYIYLPSNVGISPAPPLVRFWEPLHDQVTVELGENLTSIVSNVTLSNTEQIVNNNNFNGSLDSWICGGNQSIYCIWLPSDTGAQGGVLQFYGSVILRNSGYAVKYAYQLFMVPEPTDSLDISVTYSFPQAPLGNLDYNLIIAAIYKWNGTGFVLLNFTSTLIYQTPTYTTTTMIMTPNETLTPGNLYAVLVGYANVVVDGGFARGTVDFRMDKVNLTYSSLKLVFGGEVLRINTTTPVYLAVRLTSYSDNQSGLYGRLYFFNGTTIILVAVIENGTITYATSYYLRLDPTGDEYNASARLWLEVNTTRTTGDFTMWGVVTYTNGAYYVFYPFEIRVRP